MGHARGFPSNPNERAAEMGSVNVLFVFAGSASRGGPRRSYGQGCRDGSCRWAGFKAPSDDLPGGFVVEDPAVVVGAGEFGGGFFVEAEDGGGVELQGGGGVHRGDWAFDGLCHGVRFVFSRGEEDGFTGVEDGADAHGDDMEGHGVLAAEEAGVVLAGAGGEGFDASAGGEGGGRFVEADVSVGADAEKLEVDASCGADFFLVASAE